jgi:hypothetical protein
MFNQSNQINMSTINQAVAVQGVETLNAGDSINITLYHWTTQSSGGKGNFIKWYFSSEVYSGVVNRLTDKAILISVTNRGDLWLPKSKIRFRQNVWDVCSNFCKYAQMKEGFPKWIKPKG